MQLGLSLDDNPAVSLLTLCFGWLLTLPKSIEIRIPEARYFCSEAALVAFAELTFGMLLSGIFRTFRARHYSARVQN